MKFYKHDDPNTDSTDLYKEAPPDLKSHVLFGGGGASVGLMTADAPRFPVNIRGGNEALKHEMGKMGLKYEAIHGSYGGPENSFIVHNPTVHQMRHLATNFGQEAFVHGSGGTHELHYALGPNAGKFHPSLPLVRYTQARPEDYYTHVPGKGFVTMHFDFDRLHDAPQEGLQPMGKSIPDHHRLNYRRTVGHGVLLDSAEAAKLMGLAKSDVTKDDIKKKLLDSLYLALRKAT